MWELGLVEGSQLGLVCWTQQLALDQQWKLDWYHLLRAMGLALD